MQKKFEQFGQLIEEVSNTIGKKVVINRLLKSSDRKNVLVVSDGDEPLVLKVSQATMGGKYDPKTLVEREIAFLKAQPDFSNHRYVASGESEGKVWLLEKWQGDSFSGVGNHIRVNPIEKQRRNFVLAFRSLFQKVNDLNKLGYLHGDLHPNQFARSADGKLQLVDMSLAIKPDEGFQYKGPSYAQYMAPELIKKVEEGIEDLGEVEEVSQVYALAAIAAFTITGQLPVAGQRTLNITEPSFQRIKEVLEACLEPDSSRRIQSLQAIISEWDRHLA